MSICSFRNYLILFEKKLFCSDLNKKSEFTYTFVNSFFDAFAVCYHVYVHIYSSPLHDAEVGAAVQFSPPIELPKGSQTLSVLCPVSRPAPGVC